MSAPSSTTLDPARWRVAATPLARMRGLLGRPPLAAGDGLLLRRCAGVHTCFMRAPIDVVFLSGDGDVLHVVPRLRPWHAVCRRGAHAVLELPPGTCAAAGIRPGDRLELP